MSRLKLAGFGILAIGCALSSPSLADEMKNGMMMMISPDGKTSTMPIDKHKAEMMMKHAEKMDSDMAFFVWGNKLYAVKNEKMSDGKMSFDYWGLHGVR